jgi:hypothetical protein
MQSSGPRYHIVLSSACLDHNTAVEQAHWTEMTSLLAMVTETQSQEDESGQVPATGTTVKAQSHLDLGYPHPQSRRRSKNAVNQIAIARHLLRPRLQTSAACPTTKK